MRTITNPIPLIKLVIFLGGLCVGATTGLLMDHYRSGIFLGIAIGLTGITGFLYYLEWMTKRKKMISNSKSEWMGR